MSSQSSRLTLSPAELDRIEDALEDLEMSSSLDLDLHGDGDDDDPVARRLVEFREILQLSRQALPMEDVPAGLLDGVLAQARQAASTGAAAPERPSLWSRWRLSVWLPTLAFAGSAALLLLVLVPTSDEAPTGDAAVARRSTAADAAAKQAEAPPAEGQPSDGRLALAEPHGPAPGSEPEPVRGQGLAIGERAPEPAAAEPIEEEDHTDADDEAPAEKKEPVRSKRAAGASGAGAGADVGGLPKPTPAPKAPASSGSKGKADLPPIPAGDEVDDEKAEHKPSTPDLWPEITRADADRRAGNCGLAKMRYDKARKADEGAVRARALAGLGLCAAAEGDMSTAKKLFAQARAADPGVGGFIDRERAAQEQSRANAAPQQTRD